MQYLSGLEPNFAVEAGDTWLRLNSPQTSGWLRLSGVPWGAAQRRAWRRGWTQAQARGFVAADCAVLAAMSATDAARAQAQGMPPRPRLGWASRSVNLPALHLGRSDAPPTPDQRSSRSVPLEAAPLGLYPVVDSVAWIHRLLRLGVRTLQLRIKGGPPAEHRAAVADAVAAARASGARLFINDHWALALEVGAWGVHLGQDDLAHADVGALAQAGLRLGVSTHSVWELARAASLKPATVACGPVYPTTSKPMPWRAQGRVNLAWWCAVAPCPVVAIGGLTAARLPLAVRCGAQGVAMISAITQAPSPDAATRRLLQAWQAAQALPRWPTPAWPRPSLLP